MSDPLDNLFDETLAQPEPEALAPEQAAPEPAPQAEEPSTGVTAAPPVATETQDQRIPITALLDEREKRQQAERRAQEIERRLAEYEAQRQQQPKPDFFDNPEAVLAAERARYEHLILQTKVQMSASMRKPEEVQEVVEFFNDPRHVRKTHEFIHASDPIGAAMSYMRQQKALEKIGDDPDKWIEAQVEARLAERLAQAQAPIAQPAPVQAKPNPPPRSIASQPGAASPKATIPVDPLFD